ncbi:hypothetical protein MCHI_001760 [Candidatus Magnetoovum chiemensis]|nr:hypothetical protein MCHI_001760 [Candidatus Magnetoovum chiemensis]
MLAEDRKVCEMTIGELRELIFDVVNEAVDPDYGLEMKDEFAKGLDESLDSTKRIPVEVVAEKLGFKW